MQAIMENLEFQSTFPRGERHAKSNKMISLYEFQSTFPRGERRSACHVYLSLIRISIHVPAWGTTRLFSLLSVLLGFQSTFPRGERRPIILICLNTEVKFQSTFPRGERPLTDIDYNIIKNISIHVPAWGTTTLYCNDTNPQGISIHVPAWGTTNSFVVIHNNISISIHVPAWGTTDGILIFTFTNNISIHVPAWGTTANFHKYSLLFYAINIIFLLFIIPSLFSLVLFILLF